MPLNDGSWTTYNSSGSPFGRLGRLIAITEELRAENWPIENSLQEQTEADPDIESVLDYVADL